MSAAAPPPAFYAAGEGRGGWRDWVTLLHPPYTAWHLAYVALGASLVPRLVLWKLGASLLAFFLAVGVGAHALDELHGHPLRTGIADRALGWAAAGGVAGAVGLGLALGGLPMVPFVLLGGVLVVGYNLELCGGRLHNAAGFAAGWGAFPLVTGYFAQHLRLGPAVLPAAAGAFALSWAQRSLSTPARTLRRRALAVQGRVELSDGGTCPLEVATLLAPLESALRALSWAVVLLAAGAVTARLG